MAKIQTAFVCKKMSSQSNWVSGVTLPEILIVLTISSLLILVLSNWVITLYRQQQQQQQLLQLQQMSQSALQMMSKDLRRSGYRRPRLDHNFALFQVQNRSLTLNLAKQDYYQCVLFFYDLNLDGCIGSAPNQNQSCVVDGINNSKDIQLELFGYRFQAGNLERLAMFSGENQFIANRCNTKTCQLHLLNPSCESRGWTKFFDPKFVVKHFAFRWLADQQGVAIELTLALAENPQLGYAATAIVPLINEVTP